jgi:UDP-GlcNAc:undecaprenyl-phosphate/decaprenyl-phosphate GlcNAc-1-phosphate transferase
MQQFIFEACITFFTALIISLMIIPVLSRYSVWLGLVDKPNYRKVHKSPVPVTGGLAIVIAGSLALLLAKSSLQLLMEYPVLLGSALFIFLVGLWDDRKNIQPVSRLLLQFLCAAAIAGSGIRLTSLYGILGVEQLPLVWQYALTILIITGVANAFNLMDGIDGLAGGLALLNLGVMSVLSFLLNLFPLFVFMVTLMGALLGFLRNNFHPARIFMGDGGSLMLGFIMPVAGILFIEKSSQTGILPVSFVILLVSVMLVIPVFDSLRVYAGRMKRGDSPFSADKTHLHHLFLLFGLNHKWTASIIFGLEIILIILGIFLHKMVPFSLCLLLIVSIFLLVCQVLQLNSGVERWTREIRKMESSGL